jgi:5-deoxy-glucuronate isomerase
MSTMPFSFIASENEGYQRIVGPGSGLKYFQEYGILRLADGRYEDDSAANEVMVHIVRGRCTLTVEGQDRGILGERETPFVGKPTAVYFPPRTKFAIQGHGLEAVISSAAATPGGNFHVIRPDDLSSMLVGKDNWQRTVTMIAPPDYPSQSLIVGETLNPSGNWSGVPAHKHDQIGSSNESIQEEIYFFHIEPNNGWGLLRIYGGDGLDEMIRLQDRSVTIIPKGYHTVAAAPGSTMLYTFHLAGPMKKLSVTEDASQAWIKQS